MYPTDPSLYFFIQMHIYSKLQVSNPEISKKSNMKYQYDSANIMKDKNSQNKSLLRFIIIKPHANIIGHPVSFIVLSWFKTEKRKKGKRSINPTKQQGFITNSLSIYATQFETSKPRNLIFQ